MIYQQEGAGVYQLQSGTDLALVVPSLGCAHGCSPDPCSARGVCSVLSTFFMLQEHELCWYFLLLFALCNIFLPFSKETSANRPRAP